MSGQDADRMDRIGVDAMSLHTRPRRRYNGGILLSVLIMAVVIATILAGLGTLIVSYYSRVNTESMYAGAINLADAGVNYELRRINENVSNADLQGTTTPAGSTVSLGAGTFSVYCTMMNGATWDKATVPFIIHSTGTDGASSRIVTITATGSSPISGNLGIFSVNGAISTGPGTIVGNVGTDGDINVSGSLTISGTVYFYGSSAGWNPIPSNTYTSVSSPTAVTWPTTANVALSNFPSTGATAPGGFSYLSVHNDNALASPPITGDTINLSSGSITLNGKAGGANYYITSLSMSGPSTLSFNNSAGPITVWQGPIGGNGTFKRSGGSAVVSMASDPSKAVRFYVATTNGITLTGASELDAGVYNITGGSILTKLTGPSAIDGQVICDSLSMTGGSTLNATSGYFSPNLATPYQYSDGTWQEANILQ